jgi:5-methyltetrahydropteroyltriglutamate--homocysteine methyltransferase
LREVENEAILECLEDQRRVGVEVFTDGEFRRDAFNTGPSQAIDGFDDNYPVNEQRRPDGTVVLVEAHGKPVRGKLRQMRRIAGDDASFLKLHAPGPFKITMISPNGITHLWRAGVTDPAVYPSEDELRPEVEAIFKSEVQALVADGAAYIQFDEGFVRFINAATMDSLREQGVDLEHALEADIASENACYDLLPDGVLAACHLCRGNRVPWGGGTGGFEGVAVLAQGQGRRTRVGQHQESSARTAGRAPAADQRGGALLSHRAAGLVSSVWLPIVEHAGRAVHSH